MRFDRCNGGAGSSGEGEAVGTRGLGGGKMPYVVVRENKSKWWNTVVGLNHHEVRLLAEKLSDQPESQNDKEKEVVFSVPTWQILNALERLGYKVVTSSGVVTGHGKHDNRLHIRE
jgi:hypothetical protein